MYKISKKQLIYATNVMKSWCEANDLLSPIYTTVARGGVLVLPQSICKSIAITAQKLSRFVAADAKMGQG